MGDDKVVIKFSKSITLEKVNIKDNCIILKSTNKHFSNIFILDIDSNNNIVLRFDNGLKPDYDDFFKEEYEKEEPPCNKPITDKQELFKNDFKSSTIINNIITDVNNNIICSTITYSSIIKSLYISMPVEKIPIKATFIKIGKVEGRGSYIPKLNMTINGNDANATIKEIINLVELNNYSININIKLKNGDNIYFKK